MNAEWRRPHVPVVSAGDVLMSANVPGHSSFQLRNTFATISGTGGGDLKIRKRNCRLKLEDRWAFTSAALLLWSHMQHINRGPAGITWPEKGWLQLQTEALRANNTTKGHTNFCTMVYKQLKHWGFILIPWWKGYAQFLYGDIYRWGLCIATMTH